jgi:3-phenylpropionate/cinnamic acid dioxygenase small subunit
MARAAVPVELRLEIEEFLAREAELLDDRQLNAWLALFADDARYAVRLREPPTPPSRDGGGVVTPSSASEPATAAPDDAASSLPSTPPSMGGPGGLSSSDGSAPLFEDDKEFLALRVRRLASRLAHAERPPSTTRHLITNVVVEVAADDAVDVRASFMVCQLRPGLADQLFFGKRQDHLRRVAGEWRIARRLVTIDQNPLPRTLTIFF